MRETAHEVTVQAPGKVNLTLEILGKRPDGYHELRSILMPVSVYETVQVRTRADGEVTLRTIGEGVDCSELERLPMEKQLAYRAVVAMRRACNRPDAGCDIRILKRIPIGAGMGGGSADAAGVLCALRALWNPALPEADYLAAGASIGSDIPALQLGGAVRMEGRGERVSRLLPPGTPSPKPFWLVVVHPGFPISTRSVYEAVDAEDFCLTQKAGICENCARSVCSGDVRAAAQSLFNGLQRTVSRLYPNTEYFETALGKGGAIVTLLSGSGSAVFGLAENEETAKQIQRSLPPNVWSNVVQTLPDGVMAAHGPLVP